MNSETGFYRSGKDTIKNVMSEVEAKYHNPRSFQGVPTGFRHIDLLTDGLRDGEVTLVMSHSGDLATSFLLSIARNMLIKYGKSVRFISFQHTEDYVVAMLLSICSQIPISGILSGDIDPGSFATLVNTASTIYESSFELASIAPGESRFDTNLLYSGQLASDVVILDGVGSNGPSLLDFLGSMRGWAKSKSFPVVLSSGHLAFESHNPDSLNQLDSVVSLHPASGPTTVTLAVDRNRHGPRGTVSLEYESGGLGLQSVDSTGRWNRTDVPGNATV